MNATTKKNLEILESFYKYAKKHPWKKFWCALRDWDQTKQKGKNASLAEIARPAEINKTEKLHIRMTKEAKQELRAASKAAGMGMSSYITNFLMQPRLDREQLSDLDKLLSKFKKK